MMPCSERCYSIKACDNDEESRLPTQSIPKLNPYSRSKDHVYPRSVVLKYQRHVYHTNESHNVASHE